MKLDWSFAKQISVALATVTALTAYPLVRLATSDVVHSVIYGGLIATCNVLVGYAAVEYSFDKPASTFLKVVLGGMAVRILVVGAIIALLIEFAHVHVGGLVGSLGVCYTVFLVIEILFIQRKVSVRQQS